MSAKAADARATGASVLLVDDDEAIRASLGQTLALGGYRAITAASFIEAKDHITGQFDGVIVSDIRMPGKDGFALLAHAAAVDEGLPVILLTGEGDIPTAVRGMSEGAFDFLEKPCDTKHLLEVVDKALGHRRLVLENRALREDLKRAQHESIAFLGRSDAAARIREQVRRAGRAQTAVLISGERGAGRGHVARLIAGLRGNAGKLRPLDLRTRPDFGAVSAQDGPVLLTGLEDLPLADQRDLADWLGAQPQGMVHAATGPDPEQAVQNGMLDDELFYMLSVMRIHVPALRDRPEDIPILYEKFLREEIDAGAPLRSETGQAALDGRQALDWTVNLRSLRNYVKRVAWGLADDHEALGLKARLERVERGLIEDALRRHAGQATQTAEELQLPRKTFYDRLQKLGIRPEDFRG